MRSNRVLWTVQGVLALLFAFAGVMKLVMPLEDMAGPVALPGLFLRLIGVAEVLGAVGLVAPGVLKLYTSLTPLAAGGLTIIMVGATLVSAMATVAAALFPFVVGLLTVTIVYGRWPRCAVGEPA